MKKTLVVLALMVALQGCSRGPAIDASTQKTMQDSIQVMRDSLEGDALVEFDNSLGTVVAATIDPLEIIDRAYTNGRLPTQESAYLKLKPVLDKKRIQDVLAMRDKARENLATRSSEWRAQQQKLNLKYQAFLAAKDVSERVVPVSANLTTVDSPHPMLGDNSVVVDVVFRNDLSQPVREINFNLMLMPMSVQRPWVTQNVKKKFEAPVLPGATGKITTDRINILIPDTFKGDIRLETQIDVKGVDTGGGMVMMPTWDNMDTVILAKYEAAIEEADKLLRTFSEPVSE